MASNLRIIGFVLFFAAMLGFVTKAVSSGTFLVMILVATGFNVTYLVLAKKFPFNAGERRQQSADRTASLTAALPAGYGNVYIYREASFTAPVAVQASVAVSGVAELRPAAFAKWTLPAGQYTARAAVKGTNMMAENESGSLTFDLPAGQSMYLQIKVTANLSKYTAHLTAEPDGPGMAAKVAKLTIAAVQA